MMPLLGHSESQLAALGPYIFDDVDDRLLVIDLDGRQCDVR